MGRRVDNARNEVVSVDHPDGRLAAEEAVFCAHDGQPDGDPPQGYAPVEYAERNWIEVDGQLCCSIYCAAKVAGLTEEQAQLARGAAARANLRAEGYDELADTDERLVKAMVAEEHLDRTDPERQYPLAARLADLATEDTAEHGIPPQDEGVSADQELFEQITSDSDLMSWADGEASEADEGGDE
jgi:hypothetical protein